MKPQRRIPVLILVFLAVLFHLSGAGSTPAKKSAAAPPASKSASKKAPATKSGGTKSGATKSASGKSSTSKSKSTRASSSKKKGKTKSARSTSQRTPEPARVQEIQQALAQRGYNCQTSGVWDSSTVEALKKFQEDKNITNLTGRGKLDSLTLIALGLGPQRDNPSPAPTAPAPTGQPEGKNE